MKKHVCLYILMASITLPIQMVGAMDGKSTNSSWGHYLNNAILNKAILGSMVLGLASFSYGQYQKMQLLERLGALLFTGGVLGGSAVALYNWYKKTEKKVDSKGKEESLSSNSSVKLHDFLYAISECKGRRPAMEDASVVQEIEVQGKKVLFLGLFDGHSGSEVAEYCKDNMPKMISKKLNKANEEVNYKMMLTDVFHKIDKKVREDAALNKIGSTAVVGIIEVLSGKKMLHIAWVGDSRALCIGEDGKIIEQTKDHDLAEGGFEFKRVKKVEEKAVKKFSLAHYPIIMCIPKGTKECRIGGVLNTARAIGDKNLKPYSGDEEEYNTLIAAPDYKLIDLNENNIKYILFACDGVFEPFLHRSNKDLYKLKDNEQEQNDVIGKVLTDLLTKDNAASIPQIDKQYEFTVNGNHKESDVLTQLTKWALDNNSKDNMSAILMSLPN